MAYWQLWHTLRHADGSWQPAFVDIDTQSAGNFPDGFLDVACGNVAGPSLHVAAVANGGRLYHTIRDGAGNWQAFMGDIESQSTLPAGINFQNIACAGAAGGLHVVAASEYQLCHTIRHADGSWQPAFDPIESRIAQVRLLDIACGGPGGILFVVIVTEAGELWHTTRHPDETWDDHFTLVPNASTFRFIRVGCTAVGSDIHIVAVNEFGLLYHTIRFADGSWQPFLGLIESQSQGGAPAYGDVACGSADGTQLQVVAVAIGTNGYLWHTVRFANGAWQGTFGLIESVTYGGPAGFRRTGCAGAGSALQVAASAD